MTEVQRLAKIMILKDMRKEYELRAKYNGGVDYDCYRALDMAIEKLEQEPCTDAISRQAVLEQTYEWSKDEFLRVTNPLDYLRKRINSLPPVNPTEKVGQWIKTDKGFSPYECSVCGSIEFKGSTYCPYCRAKMQEVEE